MTKYVVGFAYDAYNAVAMILKNKPVILAGKWNGVGGKVEASDPSIEFAMSREFHEETGQDIIAERWRQCGEMQTGMGTVYVLTTRVPLFRVHTNTKEEVRVFRDAEQYLLGTEAWPCMSNIQPLLALTQMPPDPTGRIPYFNLNYIEDDT